MAMQRQVSGSSSSETWWAFLTLVPFLNWLAFLYIGLRANYSNWKVWAAIYAAPSVLWILLPDLTDALVWPFFGLYFISIYHAFRVRADYNRRMDAKRGVIAPPVTVPSFQSPPSTATPIADPVDAVIPSRPSTPVDVNNAPEDAIAAIPGIGKVLAMKAVSERQKRGGFKSLEDFGQALSLQPHVVERIRPIVVIAVPQAVQIDQAANTGRVVDV